MFVSETWLTDARIDFVNFDRYHAIHNYRTDIIGGGVSFNKYLQYREKWDVFHVDKSLETCFGEINKDSLGADSTIIVRVIYGPPDSDVLKFLANLKPIIGKLAAENKPTYLLGYYKDLYITG